MDNFCEKCKFYRNKNYLIKADYLFSHKCDAGEYYFIRAMSNEYPDSFIDEDNKIIYTDSHLELFLSNKIFCPQKFILKLQVIYPLLISIIAVLLSIISLVFSK